MILSNEYQDKIKKIEDNRVLLTAYNTANNMDIIGYLKNENPLYAMLVSSVLKNDPLVEIYENIKKVDELQANAGLGALLTNVFSDILSEEGEENEELDDIWDSISSMSGMVQSFENLLLKKIDDYAKKVDDVIDFCSDNGITYKQLVNSRKLRDALIVKIYPTKADYEAYIKENYKELDTMKESLKSVCKIDDNGESLAEGVNLIIDELIEPFKKFYYSELERIY